jgi:hypothetical protein
MPTTPGRPFPAKPNRSQPTRRRRTTSVGVLVGFIFGIRPYQNACSCIRCTLHRLGVYRREHVRYGKSAYVRITVFGIRILPDRYAFPLH